MQLSEIRKRYLAFFEKRGHAVIPSASLVPENDPTTLFTGSGMQPLVPYLLGKNHPVGTRLVNSQKCFRAMDVEEVGDNRHTTFFEMLGNWSLGDYFKAEQLPWFFEFLTDTTEGIGLDPRRLYVTAFIGDPANSIPRDDEAAEIWKTLFASKGIEAATAEIGSEANGYERGIIPGERIFFYDAKKNWWSRSGMPDKMPAGEPGGPDSEMFYEFTEIEHDEKFGRHCHPNCDCGRFLEIGNSVFMEYIKNTDGTFSKLPKRNVDFGGGLERIAAASIGSPDVFKVDVLAAIISDIEKYTDISYEGNERAFRIIVDHLRAAVFLIADGTLPGNKDRGYFVRRLLRRATLYLERLKSEKLTAGFVAIGTLAHTVAVVYQDQYPEIKERIDDIDRQITEEESKFRATLIVGLKEIEKMFPFGKTQRVIEGQEQGVFNRVDPKKVFDVYQTYGFPIELIEEELAKRLLVVDMEEFEAEKAKHQDLSRAGSEQKFKGGLADTAEQTVRLHTAHHLLLRALQIVLGPEVHQRGSNITQERLRIDFSYDQKMTDEQKKEVERIVNEKIAEDLPVIRSEMSLDEAETLGAEHEFGQKYPDRVSVYSVGPKDATQEEPKFKNRFSIEFCGGPHVAHTGELASDGTKFVIIKEEAVASGIRRIKAVLQ